jgi:hypothetical protein
MITVFGQHGVADFEAWKSAFDTIPEEHYVKYKIVGTGVYRMIGDSGVIVTHTFNTLEDAQNHKAIDFISVCSILLLHTQRRISNGSFILF